MNLKSDYRSFYDERRPQTYAEDCGVMLAEGHAKYHDVEKFIEMFNLQSKRCLEIGSARGVFQDMVDDYWGTDIAESLAKYYHKPYMVADASHYPFEDEMFDAIWTLNAYEHIPDIQGALLEIKRLLKPGGVVLFSPAWQCRPWASKGYAVRPYSDLDWKGKIIKACIPIRNSVIWRSLHIFPKRLVRHFLFCVGHRFMEIRFHRLKANYEVYWSSDSDACNSIDPHDVILWFLSQGFECVSHPTHLSVFVVRNGTLIFRKQRVVAAGS